MRNRYQTPEERPNVQRLLEAFKPHEHQKPTAEDREEFALLLELGFIAEEHGLWHLRGEDYAANTIHYYTPEERAEQRRDEERECSDKAEDLAKP